MTARTTAPNVSEPPHSPGRGLLALLPFPGPTGRGFGTSRDSSLTLRARRATATGFLVLVATVILRSHGAEPPSSPSPTNVPKALVAPPVSELPKLPVVPRPTPTATAVGVPLDQHLDRTPPRLTKGLDLVKLGWSYNCMECHKLLQARWHYDRPMVEHQNLKLEHGENRFCLNCHHPTNRNAFVDYDGSEIREADVFLLCAKCHGTTYRDWKAGVHGRRNGFWNTSLGPQTRLRCIECHDPHSPKFAPLQPLAPLRYPDRAPNPPAAHAAPSTVAAHP